MGAAFAPGHQAGHTGEQPPEALRGELHRAAATLYPALALTLMQRGVVERGHIPLADSFQKGLGVAVRDGLRQVATKILFPHLTQQPVQKLGGLGLVQRVVRSRYLYRKSFRQIFRPLRIELL